MALDDDLLRAVEERINASKERVAVVGTVSSVEPLTVVFDGASLAVPCSALDDTNLQIGKRVCVARWGVDWVVVGALGNRVTHFPNYTGADPTDTNPGDAWYRVDLNAPYMNVAGVATEMIAAPAPPAPTVYTEVLDADFSFGTSITTITGLTLEGVPAGKYRFQVDLDWTLGGTVSTVSLALDFSGTISDSQYKMVRYTSSAIVMTPDLVLGTIYATSTTVPQGATLTGFAEFGTSGDFTVWIRRSASTSGTLKQGAVVLLSPLTA